MRRETLIVTAVATGLWTVMAIAMDPRGEFPLMDDWIFVRAVLTWTGEGRLELPSVTQMVALGQIALGAGLVQLFGPSFQALHLSMMVLGLASVAAVYVACRSFGSTPPVAAVAGGTLLVNPVFLMLSATFMTDVPFFLSSTLALTFFARALRGGRWTDVLPAILFSMAAASIRQTGLIFPAAFLVAHHVAHPFGRRVFVQAVLPFTLVAVQLVISEAWLAAAGLLPGDYNLPLRSLVQNVRSPSADWALHCVKRLLNIGFHLGWFLLPFVVSVGHWTRPTRRATFALTALVGIAVAVTGKVAPWGSSLLYDFGIGAVSLRDVSLLGLPHLPDAPRTFWLAATLVSGAVVSALVVQWLALLRQVWRTNASTDQRFRRAATTMAMLALAGFVVPMALSWFYDRYLLPLLPCLMLYAALQTRHPPRWPWRLTAAAAALFLFLGAAGAATVHDYFAWNRARWAAIRFLLQQAEPQEIDGGYEFSGWHLYSESGQWRAQVNPRYLVTFGPVVGHKELAQFPYSTWLPPRRAAIRALERIE